MIKRRYTTILIIVSTIFSLLVLVVPFLTKYLIDEAINLSNDPNLGYDKLILYIILISFFTLLSVLIVPSASRYDL